MTPNEVVMELSLNISEDENCTFITSNLLEQSENFDEWLDKNGVHFIINNERLSDNTSLTTNPLDPLLNQLNVSENEAEVIHSDLLQSDVKPYKFTGLTCKSQYLEHLFQKGIIYVEFQQVTGNQTNENQLKLSFTNSTLSNAINVFPTCYINLNEVGGQLSIPKERVSVITIENLALADDLDAIMTCLTLSTGLKLFICPQIECQAVYTRIAAGKLHSLMHLGHKPFKCSHSDCTWAFYTSFKLRRHQESHLNHKDFICEVLNCGRRFTNIYNLNIHVKNHARPATLPCPVTGCGLKFQTSRMREKHFKTHDISEAPFVCPEETCSRAFFLMTGLQSHARSHSHKDSEVRCDYPNCGKVFKLPCRLREHARAHTGQRPYVCDYDQCTWSFTSSSKLRRHQSSHKNERKFHCTIGDCSKSFLRPEHLKEHTLTHIGPRTYTCEGKQSILYISCDFGQKFGKFMFFGCSFA